jgi:methionyl-tRNA synthetase
VLEFSTKCNQYFQHREPWGDNESRPTTIFYSCNFLASLAVLLYPFLPFSAEGLRSQLALDGGTRQAGWDSALRLNVKPGHKIGKVVPLFKKVEDDDLAKAEKLLG